MKYPGIRFSVSSLFACLQLCPGISKVYTENSSQGQKKIGTDLARVEGFWSVKISIMKTNKLSVQMPGQVFE